MIQLDLSDHRPLYEQIKEKLQELIITGILREGEKIPSVRELAKMLTINPNTIQKAYKDLENDGYIYSVRAKGNFVAPIKYIRDKAKTQAVMDEFCDVVKKACFLGEKKEDLIRVIENVYKEGLQ